MNIAIVLPLKIESVANLREHWAKRASRAKSHRLQTWAELRRVDVGGKLLGPVAVKLTRIAPRRLDDDNLRSAFKATRDGVADWLGVPDNDPRIAWGYDQESGGTKYYAARIEVQW